MEIQTADKELMQWDDRLFPFTEVDGELIPEAYPAREGLLPHMHADMYERFPRALSAGEPDDPDPDANDFLEKRGHDIGANVVRFADPRNERGNRRSTA